LTATFAIFSASSNIDRRSSDPDPDFDATRACEYR
jgi:hypothetical protein